MKKVLIILLIVFLVGCKTQRGGEMYIEIYDRDLNHITNLNNVEYKIVERVFDLDTSSFSGTSKTKITNELIFVLSDPYGKQIYSGYIKNFNQTNELVTFNGDDFKKIFNSEVILDYATELKTSPAKLGELFKDVFDAVINQNQESLSIVPIEIIYPMPTDDIYWIANYDNQYLTINANKFLKTYLAYFGYFINKYFDTANKKIVFEIKESTKTATIKLEDFTHETTRSETLTNKAVATLKFNNIKQDERTWILIGQNEENDYYERQPANNKTEDDDYGLTGYPSIDPTEYPLGFAVKVTSWDTRFPEPVIYGITYWVNSVLAVSRPPNLPLRTYYLGNDNLIYEETIPQDKLILPTITKVFEEEFFQSAQFYAVTELVNSRFNQNIIITNVQTPIDLSNLSLYTMVNVYDKNGVVLEMPLAEIEQSNNEYKIKLGFKKSKFTDIVKDMTDDKAIKSTGASGGGGTTNIFQEEGIPLAETKPEDHPANKLWFKITSID